MILQKYNFEISFDLNIKYILYLRLLIRWCKEYESPGSIYYRITFEPDMYYKRLLFIKSLLSKSNLTNHEKIEKRSNFC